MTPVTEERAPASRSQRAQSPYLLAPPGAGRVVDARLSGQRARSATVRCPDGIRATRLLVAHTECKGTHVLMLTTFDLDKYVFDVLLAVPPDRVTSYGLTAGMATTTGSTPTAKVREVRR